MITKLSKTIASALVVRDNAVLLVRRAKDYGELPIGTGYWELPGGKTHEGEPDVEALRRELKEEIGLVLPLPFEPRLTAECTYTLQVAGILSERTHLIYALPISRGWDVALSNEHDEHRFVKTPEVAKKLIQIPEISRIVVEHLSVIVVPGFHEDFVD